MRHHQSLIAIIILLYCSSCDTISQPLLTGLELPAITDSTTIVQHVGYIASFNSKYMIPNWVAYELTAYEVEGALRRPNNSPFQQDPEYNRRQPERRDYSNSGWDKGHLAPCADMKWSNQAMIESFYFTNVCPQNHNFNAGDWLQLEELARRIAHQKGSLYIISGPIVKNNIYGRLRKKVVIPDFFFKAFLYKDVDGYHSIAFRMPNDQTSLPLNVFAITINDLESETGLDLFTHLDPIIQESVESQRIMSDWE